MSYALEIFGDRWTLLILRDVMLEARYRFRDLLAANKGLATNVLSDRLQRLVRRGLLSRARDDADARQFVYKPTETAISIVPMLLEMIIWSAEQGNADVPPSLVKRFKTDRDNLIMELQQQIRERADIRSG